MGSFLIKLAILFFPVQLGKHFFFDFSLVSGLRIDYYSVIIYLSDVLILLSVFFNFRKTAGFLKSNARNPRLFVALFFLVYIFLHSTFFSINSGRSYYFLFKYVEYFLFSITILSSGLKAVSILPYLSLSTVIVFIVGLGQFIFQKSLGGYFYYLGERMFNLQTPGIAKTQVFDQEILRSYSLFSHPNVFGGIQAVLSHLYFYYILKLRSLKKNNIGLLFLCLIFFLSSMNVFLSFSKLAGTVYLAGFFFAFLQVKNIVFKRPILFNPLILFYLVLIFSVIALFMFPLKISTYFERKELMVSAFRVISDSPVLGSGLLSFIQKSVSLSSGNISGLYAFQPVHNAYVLFFAELGLIGFFFLSVMLAYFAEKIDPVRRPYDRALVLIATLSLFDHYFYSLQQGQLFLVICLSFFLLKFIPKRGKI